jgi:hypothetical protein
MRAGLSLPVGSERDNQSSPGSPMTLLIIKAEKYSERISIEAAG